MTTFIRDLSHYDTNTDLSGYAGCTHKITEGRTYVDAPYVSRMPGLRAPNRVLGSYHVLHTGNLADQLQFWIDQQDKLTPWWRDWPHWIMQVDAEKWPNDPVSLSSWATVKHWGPLHQIRDHVSVSELPDDLYQEHLAARLSTTVTFAGMLKSANLHGLQIVYASRGQYGDSLAGIPLDLWNAAYHSSSYPGDDAVDWNPYSGKVPKLWQYTSTPFDKNAFRGTVDELLAYIEGGDVLDQSDKDWFTSLLFNNSGTDALPDTPVGHWVGSQVMRDANNNKIMEWQLLQKFDKTLSTLAAGIAAANQQQALLSGQLADLKAQVAAIQLQQSTGGASPEQVEAAAEQAVRTVMNNAQY